MSKFEWVLSDAELISATFKAEAEGTMGELRAVEQAVLAKLAEQGPICYLLGDPKDKPQVLSTEFMSRPNTFSVDAVITPVFAHPCVSSMSDKAACVSEIAESDTQKPIAWIFEDDLPSNYPYEAMFKYSKVDGVRMFPVYAPSNSQGILDNSNHIRDTSKMVVDVEQFRDLETSAAKIMAAAEVYANTMTIQYRGCGGAFESDVAESYKDLELRVAAELAITQENASEVPEGWQLVPKEPTMDMIKAMLATIVTTSKGGVVNPKATLAYVFAAAPKYTGEK